MLCLTTLGFNALTDNFSLILRFFSRISDLVFCIVEFSSVSKNNSIYCLLCNSKMLSNRIAFYVIKVHSNDCHWACHIFFTIIGVVWKPIKEVFFILFDIFSIIYFHGNMSLPFSLHSFQDWNCLVSSLISALRSAVSFSSW